MLLGRGFLRERPREHELGLENRPAARDDAIKGRPHPPEHRMPEAMLDALDGLTGIALVPMTVESFCCETKLNDEVAGEVLRLRLAAFLAPQPQQGSLVAPHDYPGIGAADEAPAIKAFGGNPCGLERKGHDALQFSCSRISSAALRMTPTASADKSRNRLSRYRRSSVPPGT